MTDAFGPGSRVLYEDFVVGAPSATLQIGTGFGTTPDIEQGPDGNLYVVSMTDNAIYQISRR